uniref:Uncharacterized protein n=1 Tax=Trypanosoma congolense (strain IL3000) TaxID=1068625 RepID=G0USE5_TRYCI|nr:conserved hypothetical protein [Trypanosoma congolense IL3000]
MRIKKKDLRKREAQLPINYPDPIVEQPQETLDERKARVELLCRRLAHNEVVVRDDGLAQVPSYVQSVTERLVAVEANVDRGALLCFLAMREKGNEKRKRNGKVTINILRELDLFHAREENVRREKRRSEALLHLQQQRAGDTSVSNNSDLSHGKPDVGGSAVSGPSGHHKSVRCIYREWITQWSEVELLLLKLSRGLFFCLWHSDKPLVQHECARKIAHVLRSPQTNSGKLLFMSCMMRVLAREWRTMDRYRSDKFLAFVRKLIFELLCLLKSLEGTREGQLNDKGGMVCPRVAHHDEQEVAQGTTNHKEDENVNSGEVEMSNSTFCEPLQTALGEVYYIFQQQVVPEPAAVGLSMHICDVFFDELCRAEVSPALFIALGNHIVLYAMSKGDFVEKRALDYFIAPLAGGMLEARMREQYERNWQNSSHGSCTVDVDPGKNDRTSRKKGRAVGHPSNGSSVEGGNQAAIEAAAAETSHYIIAAIADCCRRYSVSRGTVHDVRPMFAESEMALRQALSASDCLELSSRELRRRIEREVDDMEETRAAISDERQQTRLKRLGKRGKAGTRKSSRKGAGGVFEESGKLRRAKRETGKPHTKNKKGTPRSTRRKKHITLTKSDLYGVG